MADNLRNYDLTYLEELSAGDSGFVRSIITQFVSEAPLAIKKIKAYVEQRKWLDLNYEIHKFGSNLAFIGLNDIKNEVSKVEISSKNLSDLAEIPVLVDIIVQRCELAIASLTKDFEL